MTQTYLTNLFKTHQKGDAREESYYKHLADFIAAFSESQRKKIIDVTILPKKTEAGNPDFRIWDGRQKIIGYIEAKDLGVDLDRVEDSEQLERYLSTFPNVILTNFTEFRLYRNGERMDRVAVARPFVIKKLSTAPPLENEDKLFKLLERFLDFSLPKTYTAKTLAVELAKRTRFLKDQIITEEFAEPDGGIHEYFNAFKQYLIAEIGKEEFADLYAQTITYGLFAARLRTLGDFNRLLAYSCIPKSSGILKQIFSFISAKDKSKPMDAIIDDIADVLAVADAKKILDHYYHEGKGSDPVLHFYETFLSVYDPAAREKRGVYYTMDPVVSFIVRSLHHILKEKFGIADGLAAKNVTLLDPAGGTLSFLAKAIEVAVDEFKSKYGKGAVRSFLQDHILQNFYAFELMMAPYAIGHIKLSFLLEELGYRMEDDERVKYYLTNTLDMRELDQSKFPGMSSLSAESRQAGKVKKQVPIIVVLGNPPYSGHSSNSSKDAEGKLNFIGHLLQDYYQVDGKPLGEKNPKWLQDDYVKFIRFSQWKIDQAGEGVLGFITNHSYLDNPTFRGMRQSLMNSFDEIYILDLHGSSLRKEKAPDGSKDENVFDIQQGVAIAFFIKYKNGKKKQVYHQDIFGLREAKYDWLDKHSIENVSWNKLEPAGEFYLFIPQDRKLHQNYQAFTKITEIFPVNSVGIVTSRDNFVIDFDKRQLENRIRQFIDAKYDEGILKLTYGLKENKGWKIKEQREKLRKDTEWQRAFTQILYRPFDLQWIFYHDEMIERTRKETMRHMLEENVALCVGRQFGVIGSEKYDIVFVSEDIVDFNLYRRGGELVFPLYGYPDADKKDLFSDHETGEKKPNIKAAVFAELKKNYQKEVSPEELFYYIYAVLYSHTYRAKYAQFLRIDFPRLPFTKNHELFIRLGHLGKRLADLHLLKSKELDDTVAKFPQSGTNTVDKIRFDIVVETQHAASPRNAASLRNAAETEHAPSLRNVAETPSLRVGRVYINAEQYFDGVTEEVWRYQIGGYQVCDKWLKDRKGRALALGDIQTYCRIVTALAKTIELQKEIDELYESVEKTV